LRERERRGSTIKAPLSFISHFKPPQNLVLPSLKISLTTRARLGQQLEEEKVEESEV